MSTFTGAVWRKSSRSGYPEGHWCVEVAEASDGAIGIRDSKNPEGDALVVNRSVFDRFLRAVKAF